ncbi:hypothetical protein B0H94_103184 [Salsuginibacillus halophilus]|uniref:Uncharacterized protein n=1 Tax=Salsuginibacillus halophilus TaxID=517424 RepID=A0A2P8HWH4_9BACI|nr:hypothetical protein [Salsuginibacillus halophilus]PSL50572.1 hypothetical protein B0H94_103184 [Salsuginibacillus halophilus]
MKQVLGVTTALIMFAVVWGMVFAVVFSPQQQNLIGSKTVGQTETEVPEKVVPDEDLFETLEDEVTEEENGEDMDEFEETDLTSGFANAEETSVLNEQFEAIEASPGVLSIGADGVSAAEVLNRLTEQGLLVEQEN